MGLKGSKARKGRNPLESVPTMLVRSGALLRVSVTALLQASKSTEYDENMILSVMQRKLSHIEDLIGKELSEERDYKSWLEAAGEKVRVGALHEKYVVLSGIGKGGETEGVMALLGRDDKKQYACKTMVLSADELRGGDEGATTGGADSHRTVSVE